MASFTRGTTPTLKFTLPFPTSALGSVYITFSCLGKEIFTKSGNNVEMNNNVITLVLSQSDTLRFISRTVDIQIRAVMTDGTAIASKIITADVGMILKNGEIE